MAKVPTSFDAEPNSSRCGNSFEQEITVTGEIANHGGAGANRSHKVGPVAQIPTGMWWSTRSSAEQAFVEQVIEARDELQGQLNNSAQEDMLTDAQQSAVVYLIALADANLAHVEALYTFWEGQGPHPKPGGPIFPTGATVASDPDSGLPYDWPLQAGDNITLHVPECAGEGPYADVKKGVYVQQSGLGFGGAGTWRNYWCPTDAVRKERATDRAAIRELLLDAARAVRCAQWGHWRMRLYNIALTEWEEDHGGFGFKIEPKGPTVTPGLGVPGLGFTPETIPLDPLPPPPTPPPFEPHDFLPPDPDKLPPPGEPEPPGGPEAGGEPTPPPMLPPSTLPQPRKILTKENAPLLVAGAALALFFITSK